ncbi:substrate-binding domain-containing protein [Microvirga sp. TS319]|uniref:substrate-binding domain-containing protein n=1 Tax=Microvirga sp. TS319 TaxID=3241165 RepID=UPI00351A7418
MAQHVDGISSMATRQILAELAALYEQATGSRVAIRSMGGVEAARLVRAAEPTDVVILAASAMEQLEGEGHILPGTRSGFARSAIAVAVRAGAERPDIDSEEAVMQALMAARRICYSTGPSGDHLLRLLDRWGIAETASQRLLQAPPGVPVGAMVARGEAELGLQQFSELLPVQGIEILGPLPPEIQATTVFTAGIAQTSAQPEKARALIGFLNSDQACEAKRRHGMEPA